MCRNPVPCCTPGIGDNGFLPARKSVQEGAFAGIGWAGNNDFTAVDNQFCDFAFIEYPAGLDAYVLNSFAVGAMQPLVCRSGQAAFDLVQYQLCTFYCFCMGLGQLSFKLNGIFAALGGEDLSQHLVGCDGGYTVFGKQFHYVGDNQRIAVTVNSDGIGALTADYDLVDGLAAFVYMAEQDFAGFENCGFAACGFEYLLKDCLDAVTEELNGGYGACTGGGHYSGECAHNWKLFTAFHRGIFCMQGRCL